MPTSTPTGTLTKKIHSQPAYSVRMPPSSSPTAPPAPAMEPHTASARLRSGPSRKVTVMIASAVGEMIAAPRPWMPRAMISTSCERASPHSGEAAVKTTNPTRNSRTRPSRSPSRPPSSRNPPKVSV